MRHSKRSAGKKDKKKKKKKEGKNVFLGQMCGMKGSFIKTDLRFLI